MKADCNANPCNSMCINIMINENKKNQCYVVNLLYSEFSRCDHLLTLFHASLISRYLKPLFFTGKKQCSVINRVTFCWKEAMFCYK